MEVKPRKSVPFPEQRCPFKKGDEIIQRGCFSGTNFASPEWRCPLNWRGFHCVYLTYSIIIQVHQKIFLVLVLFQFGQCEVNIGYSSICRTRERRILFKFSFHYILRSHTMTPSVTSCVLIRRIIQAYLTIPVGNSKGFEEKTENPMERELMIIKFLGSWGHFENSKGN